MILSEIEQRIKAKIEAIGTPLKEWNVNIYRGILTGYNDAFIINKAKKEEILANCQSDEEREKTDELIRPILRGRDIKRYGYEFADIYIITTFPSLKIDIELYPAVKQHLLSFGYDRLKQTGEKGARKKTNNKWFETQDSIGYWEDFYKQKIVWKIIGSNINFLIDSKGFFYNNAANILVSETVSLPALIAFLNSKIYEWYFKKIVFIEVEGGGIQMFNTVMEKIPIPQLPIEKQKEIENIVSKIITLRENSIDTISLERKIDNIISNILDFNMEEFNLINSF